MVTKRPAWDPGNLSITAGKYGEWGINFNYPSPFEAQVEASDLKNIAKGEVRNGGRIGLPVLDAKCKQIEKKAKEKEEQSNDASSGTGRPIPPIAMQLHMQAAFRDMISRSNWTYRGGVFGPREFLRPCDGFYTADGSGTRCYRG